MVKAVFIDYMGTTVEEHSQEMAEIVQRICKTAASTIPNRFSGLSWIPAAAMRQAVIWMRILPRTKSWGG